MQILAARNVPVDRRLWLAFYTFIHSKGHNGRGDVAAQEARWRARNPEKCREQNRAYYLRNKEKFIARAIAWKRAHPEYQNAYRVHWNQTPAGQRTALLKRLNLRAGASDDLIRSVLLERQLRRMLKNECR